MVTRSVSEGTGWTKPGAFPRLEAAKMIAIDVETMDPLLKQLGPGDRRQDGHICGLAVGTEDARWYFPCRHEDEDNFDAKQLFSWAKDELSRDNQPKIGANILYDLCWLETEGVEVKGSFHDVQYAEPLLDENQADYSLGGLGKKYVGKGKSDMELYKWLAEHFGGLPTRNVQMGKIHRAPAHIVGPYAESDVTLPFQIHEKQLRQLQEQQLFDLYQLECNLIPLLYAMRLQGVRVDLDRAEQVAKDLEKKQKEAQYKLDKLCGFEVNVNANASLAKAADKVGFKYPYTEKGSPSFTAPYLQYQTHEFAQLVLAVRRMFKARGTFVQNYILDANVDGVIHALFHPLRGDQYGTVSGRFSSSNPNLQNIPSRDPILGPLIRSIFIPFEGQQWRRYDANQIEYRLLAHYARGDGADEARAKYNDDPRTDFHQLAQQMIKDITGLELDRKSTKTINFGLLYGMGEKTLADGLGLELDKAKELFNDYHTGLPFVKYTYDLAMIKANNNGQVKTLLGRVRRFQKEKGVHSALNAVLQGSAADIMKKVMVEAFHAGVPTPLLTVHDELNFSDEGDGLWHSTVKEIMEHCVKLKVPMIWDCEVGPNWGELHGI